MTLNASMHVGLAHVAIIHAAQVDADLLRELLIVANHNTATYSAIYVV